MACAFGLIACGTEWEMAASSSCPADEPSTCPSSVPSYAADVAPLIQHYCGSCHSATGVASDQPLSTYADLKTRALNVKTQVYQCRMPMAPVEPPTLEERVTLLAWFVCGAPNN